MTSTGSTTALAPEIGRYRLVAALARGGMGNVYLAIAQGPGGFHKLLAVKELRHEFAEDETYVAMFLEEARLAARLAHPNIVQTNEVGSCDGRHYMIMEYLDGRSLYRVAKHHAGERGLPVGAHLRVIADALVGLHYAHELRGFDGEHAGIVHRDVSPLNVLVTFDGQAKVLDFGIAKAVDSPLQTQAGVLKGRIAYMAPEQARGGNVDRRADVYAAGVMIWEAAAGRRLWPGMTDVEILTRTLGVGAPRLRSVQPAAPADLDALCARAMAQKADDRHPTAAALLAALNDHLSVRRDAMSMREVGETMSRAFCAEREQMNTIIEEALLQTRGTPRSGIMPTPRASGAGAQKPAHAFAPRDDLSSIPSLLAATPSARSIPAGRSMPAASADPAAGVTIVDGSDPRRRRGERVAIVGCTLLAVGVVMAAVHRFEPLSPSSPSPQPTPSVTVLHPDPPAGGPLGSPVAAPSPAPAAPVAVPIANGPAPAPRAVPPPRGSPPQAPVQRTPRYGAPEAVRPGSAALEGPSGLAPASRTDIDPGGGHAPLRPIVTTNPYGAP